MLNKQPSPYRTIRFQTLLLLTSCTVLAMSLGIFIGLNDSAWKSIVIIFSAITLVLIIFEFPHMGLAFTVSSAQITTLLPDVPLLTSLTVLLGLLTLLSYTQSRLWLAIDYPHAKIDTIHLFGGLLIFWIFISNPLVAVAGEQNWIFTFFQLFILMWLTGQLLVTHDRQMVLLVLFSIVSIISAVDILQNSLSSESEVLIGVSGLTGGANTTARYLVVALVFLNYLRLLKKHIISSIAILTSMMLISASIIYTASRTSILLLALATSITIFSRRLFEKPRQMVPVIVLILGVMWLAPKEISYEIVNSPNTIQLGEDTMGIRYELWRAGLKMWQKHPITGIGIGKFSEYNLAYADSSDLVYKRYARLNAHNMYVQILAETGLVGFALFLGLILSALWKLWRASQQSSGVSQLARMWLIALLVMLIGGLTKHDHYDKLLWLCIGASACFQDQITPQLEPKMELRKQ